MKIKRDSVYNVLSEHPEHSKQKLAAILIIVTISAQVPPLAHPPQPPPSRALSRLASQMCPLYSHLVF